MKRNLFVICLVFGFLISLGLVFAACEDVIETFEKTDIKYTYEILSATSGCQSWKCGEDMYSTNPNDLTGSCWPDDRCDGSDLKNADFSDYFEVERPITYTVLYENIRGADWLWDYGLDYPLFLKEYAGDESYGFNEDCSMCVKVIKKTKSSSGEWITSFSDIWFVNWKKIQDNDGYWWEIPNWDTTENCGPSTGNTLCDAPLGGCGYGQPKTECDIQMGTSGGETQEVDIGGVTYCKADIIDTCPEYGIDTDVTDTTPVYSPKGWTFQGCSELDGPEEDYTECKDSENILYYNYTGESTEHYINKEIYSISKNSCETILGGSSFCHNGVCRYNSNADCQDPNTDFNTACDHHTGCSFVDGITFCKSSIISGEKCYSCSYLGYDENTYENLGYWKCGDVSENMVFLRNQEKALVSSASDYSFSQRNGLAIMSVNPVYNTDISMQFPLVYNNLVCGSRWDDAEEDYSGWIPDQTYSNSPDKRIAKTGSAGNILIPTSWDDVYVSSNGFEYEESRSTEFTVSCRRSGTVDDENIDNTYTAFVPIPLIQPACSGSGSDAFSAGAFKICPINNNFCNGYNLYAPSSYPGTNPILNYTELVGATHEQSAGQVCPLMYKPDDVNAMEAITFILTIGQVTLDRDNIIVSDDCRPEMENKIKSTCFYDERVYYNDKYYPPLFTQEVSAEINGGDEEVCTCNASKKSNSGEYPRDCGNNGDGDGYCANEVTGGLASEIICGDNGWVAGRYIEARLLNFSVINPSGMYVGAKCDTKSAYNRNILLDNTEYYPTYCQGSSNSDKIVFQKDDYISFVVSVKNTGSNAIESPMVIFAKSGFDHNSDSSFGSHMVGSSGNTTYDFVFNKEQNTLQQVIEYPNGGSVPTSSFEQDMWGFWSGKKTSNNYYVKRTTNVENIKQDLTIEPGENATFVLSLPAELWHEEGTIEVLFYDLETKLTYPDPDNPYHNQNRKKDYLFRTWLAREDMAGSILSKIEISDVGIANMDIGLEREESFYACPPGTVSSQGQCCEYGFEYSEEKQQCCKTGAIEKCIDPQEKMYYPELNFIDVSGDVQNSGQCEGCLACFASNMEPDKSFRYFWIRNETISGGDPSIVDEQMQSIDSWVGAFFLPRAYSIKMVADLSLVYDELQLSYDFSEDFNTMAYLADDISWANPIKDFYRSDTTPEMRSIYPHNATLYLAQDTEDLVFRGIINPYRGEPDYDFYRVEFSIDATDGINHVRNIPLNEYGVGCISWSGIDTNEPINISLYNNEGDPIYYLMPSLTNKTEEPPISLNDYVGSLTAEYHNGNRITADNADQWTWKTNKFEFELERDPKNNLCVWVEVAPESEVVDGYVALKMGNEYKTVELDKNGTAGYTPESGGNVWRYGEITAFLLNDKNEFLAGKRIKKKMDIECTRGCSGWSVGEGGKTEFKIKINGTEFNGKANVTIIYSDDSSDGYAVRGLTSNEDVIDGVVEFESSNVIGSCPSRCGGKETYELDDGSLVYTECLWMLNIMDSNGKLLTVADFDIIKSGSTYEVYPKKNTYVEQTDFSGYDEGFEINLPSKGVGKMPVQVNISWGGYDCNKALILEKKNSFPYVNEIPYQAFEQKSGVCTYMFVSELNQDKTIKIFNGALASEIDYSSVFDWGEIDVKHRTIFGDVINVSYRDSCGEGKGACIVAFGQYDVTCDPDTLFAKTDCTGTTDTVAGGLFLDNITIREIEFGYINETLRKCLVINYTTAGNLFDSQEVSRQACVYKGVPAIFEKVSTFNMPITRSLVNSFNREYFERSYLYTSDLLPRIINSDDDVKDSFNIDHFAAEGEKTLVLVDDLHKDNFHYRKSNFVSLTGEAVDEAFISNLHASQIVGSRNKRAIMYDDEQFTEFSAISNDFYEMILSPQHAMTFKGWFGSDEGSAKYYAKRWVDSGTHLNCENSGSYRESVFGETCGHQTFTNYFGIMRQGIHEIKFKAISPTGTSGGNIQVLIENEVGERARPMNYTRCSVDSNGHFSCVIRYDEEGNEVIADKFGYVVGCVYLNKTKGELTDASMMYHMPYVYPMKWDINFDIVVSPHSRKTVPSYIVPTGYNFVYSYHGDGVCQTELGEGCSTAPNDCKCYTIEGQVYTVPTCTENECGVDCMEGYGNCDGNWDNGCGTYLNTENAVYVSNSPFWTANKERAGMCECKQGYRDCDKNLADESVVDGCETNINTDPDNCGRCDYECFDITQKNGRQWCENGECQYECDDYYGNCDDDWSNGCETDLKTKDNCGSCNNVCGGETSYCNTTDLSDIKCSCDLGYLNCDDDWSNGCENHKTTHHLKKDCTCEEDYMNCDEDMSNGCEIEADHMSSCYECESGWGNCDGDWSNGCETDLNSDDNCGSCDNTCGDKYCSNGVCVECSDDSECDGLDGEYCNEDNPDTREYRDYYCSNGDCVYDISAPDTGVYPENCNVWDGHYCEGDTSEERNYTCEKSNGGTECEADEIISTDCLTKPDGYYCVDNGQKIEYRNYQCNQNTGQCEIKIEETKYCSGVTRECSNDNILKVTTEYCSSDGDQYCTSEVVETDCTENNKFYCDGDELKQEIWECSSGSCQQASTDFIQDCSSPYCSGGTAYLAGSCTAWYCDNEEKANCEYGCGSEDCVQGYYCPSSCTYNFFGNRICVISGSRCSTSSSRDCYDFWGSSVCSVDCQPSNSCTYSCPSNMYFDGSKCVCDSGYGDCDGDWADGCERLCGGNCCGSNEFCCGNSCCSDSLTCCGNECTNIYTDPNNCGRCGNVCSSGICTNGVCSGEIW